MATLNLQFIGFLVILQTIKTNETLSEALHITFGVPQASIVGPLIYILFKNECSDIFRGANILTNN